MATIDPIRITEALREQYVRYITTALPVRYEGLMQDLRAGLSARGELELVKGPFVEATPPFVHHGESYAQLVDRGFLAGSWREVFGEDFPADRHPYQHQMTSFERLIYRNRNLIVATGTGSGKTECFLVPILDYLLREHEAEALATGVRALLLYPMNALANDQLKRLRELLCHLPNITFGRYTGDTSRDREEARERYRKEHDIDARFADPLPNELLSRQEMEETPPHILLTNYAMLEYLLLRPQASPLFEGDTWRFLVLDEAHTYDGARGIEVGMLLRRLKDRVVRSERGRLRCIATSATLGGGDDDVREIADFASELFAEDFRAEDVVVGRRQGLAAEEAPCYRLSPQAIGLLAERVGADGATVADLARVARDLNVPADVVDGARERIGCAAADAPDEQDCVNRFLYQLLRHEATTCALQAQLTRQRVQSLDDLRKTVLSELPEKDGRDALVALIALAVRARPSPQEQSLVPARYHVFLRALEGGFVRLYGEPHLYLTPRTEDEINGRRVPVFEAGTCTNCGALFLFGKTDRGDGGRLCLTQKPLFDSDYVGENVNVFWVRPGGAEPPEDNEDELLEGDETDQATDGQGEWLLCTACGALQQTSASPQLLCDCGESQHFVSLLLVETARDDMVRKCPACQSRSQRRSIISRFTLGRDAPVAVIASALYPAIPETAVKRAPGQRVRPTRQFLSFADSRQDAAYFAPYLERTYSRIQWRRLIYQGFLEKATRARDMEWNLDDLVDNDLLERSQRMGLVPRGTRRGEVRKKVWLNVLHELLRLDRHNDLEATGCLAYRLCCPDDWRPPEVLSGAPWHLTVEEAWTLYELLCATIRTRGAVTFPEDVRADDDFFAPRNRDIFVTYCNGQTRNHVNWLPAIGRSNARQQILRKLLVESGSIAPDQIKSQVEAALWAIWDDMRKGDASVLTHRGSRDYQLSREKCLLAGPEIGNARWFRCDKCRHLTIHNVRNLCPEYTCDGHLVSCDPDEELAEHHYRQQYATPHTQVPILPMSVREHTAQLSNERAAELATEFIAGKHNVLSCSTTFELGVDIGELQCVFLRNVPPRPANYVQRAGRAGRRLDSVALVVTFAQRRTHDLYFFQDPLRMVDGTIQAPRVRVANEKIITRHMNSVALAAFWRQHPEHFYAACGGSGSSPVSSFLGTGDEALGVQRFREFMAGRPSQVRETLERIVPDFEVKEDLRFQAHVGIPDWGRWVTALLRRADGTPPGALTRTEDEYREELQSLREAMSELERERGPHWATRYARLEQILNTITNRDLIGYLASRGVLPKYGFPVDVVPLNINSPNIPEGAEDPRKLDLGRDLRIALAEYSPGCTIVAGGSIWTSRGVKRLATRRWVEYDWRLCECGRYYSRLHTKDAPGWPSCAVCGATLRAGQGYGGTFIVPEFGFNTHDEEPSRPGERRPQRARLTEVHFSGKSQAVPCSQSRHLEIRATRIDAAAWRDADLAVVTRDSFQICDSCGYAVPSGENRPSAHRAPWGRSCRGHIRAQGRYLGYEFKTDICQIHFGGVTVQPPDAGDFWYSLLYALVEGCVEALQIARDDIGGVLFYEQQAAPDIVLYDDVPGGAGHALRVVEEEGALQRILSSAAGRVDGRCGCGDDTSCYGCLRTFTNQRHHERLRRGLAFMFLRDQVLPTQR